MKLKYLTVATLSALYSMSMAVTADAGVTSTADAILQPLKIQDMKKYAQVQPKPPQTSVFHSTPGGVNQHLQPASSRNKFFAEAQHQGEDVYIVRLKDLPVATYDGRIKGYAATAKGVIRAELAAKKRSSLSQKGGLVKDNAVDSARVASIQESRVMSYQNYLAAKQDTVVELARASGIKGLVRANYSNAVNGFSMKMTQEQAKSLSASPLVAFVERSVMQQLQTDRGPTFIGADQVWAGNSVTSLPQKGEGIVIGIIDTGINTDHIAFADIGGDGYDHTNPLGMGKYLGDCASGKLSCNDKLIGVYSWPVITDSYQGLAPATGEDYQGHGSHTAGTAAGNYVENVPMLSASVGDGDGEPMGFNFDSASGVAPHANIISYQVCIPNEGCPTEAIIKAYEQAIEDGVDVINFSIGGAERFPWEDATELAILAAREAGISVAVAAGNSGGDKHNTFFGSLGHSAPWEMVVAASTSDRVMDVTHNLITFHGGSTSPELYIEPNSDDDIGGFSITGIQDATPVSAADFGDKQCLNEFSAGTFSSDQIVICERGINARVAKAFNVKAGGAGGFILYNQDWYPGMTAEEGKVYDDAFPLPGIHVNNYAGNNILNWLNDGGAEHKVSITEGVIARTLDPAAGDVLADFSSLGPTITYKHHLAPNIAAPGVNILAPYADEHPLSPGSAQSQDWAMISGTSMASPHIAGVMALVRQAHPHWSAAEVQSALEMTASQTVKRDVDPDWQPEGHPATQHRVGSGRVDAQAAVNAGLIMDETVENFTLANPNAGGDVRQLNLPQLMNSNCRGGVCSWVRTVTATRDGSWSLSADDWAYDRWTNAFEGEIDIHSVKMEFFPANFNLKAGESQSIVIKANIADIQYQHNSNLGGSINLEGMELWTQVTLTPVDASIPKAHWPVSINFDRQGLPEAVNVQVHRDRGSYRLAELPLPASNDLIYQGIGPVKAEVSQVTLPQDNNHQPIYSDGDYTPGHNQTTLVDIPEGTARFVVEVLEHTKGPAFHEWYGPINGSLAVHVGLDSNGNGVADFDDEWLCSSTTQIELNHCSFTHPDAGQYWVLLSNTSTNMVDWNLEDGAPVEGLEDSFLVATAIVPEAEQGLIVTGPAITDGSVVDLDLSWDLDDMTEGDLAYGGIAIGSSVKPGSLGFIPVKLMRGVDDVSVKNNGKVRGGDIVEVKVHVVENNTGADRDFSLSTSIPAGLSLVPGSVKVSTAEQQANLRVEGNTLRIAGSQQDSSHWMRSYKVTSNETDAMCRTNDYGNNKGGFIGLYKNYGMAPFMGGSAGDWIKPEFKIPLSVLSNGYWDDAEGINLFHNQDYMTYPHLVISPQGYVTLGQFWDGAQHIVHRDFPYFSSPYAPFIAPLWKGVIDPNAVGWNVTVDALGTPLNVDPFNPDNTSGMSFAFAYNEELGIDEVIIEWVNARTQGNEANWFGTYPTGDEKKDRYNFNLVVAKGYRYGSGQYELVMAYGDLDYAGEAATGAIGLHGNYGPLDIFGYPYGQETGIGYAFDNLDSKIAKNRVICYDYIGPEATQFDLSFKVRVTETAAGQTLNMDIVSDVSGMGQSIIANPIKVSSNITLARLKDVVIEENQAFDITVAYADADANPNLIQVSAEHVTAQVKGHEAGSSVTITPEANWFGETRVTVTVADMVNLGDKATTSFLLTVNSDGLEQGCTDSSASNFEPGANTDNGSCLYPQEIAPAPEKGKGGALGWLLLCLLPLALGRRLRA